MMRGRGPVRIRDESSRNVTARTRCTLFSIVQCPRTQAAICSGPASRELRLVMMKTATADRRCWRTRRLPVFTHTVRVTYRSTSATWRACGKRFLTCSGASRGVHQRQVAVVAGQPLAASLVRRPHPLVADVEAARRLVEEKDRRLLGERPREDDPLALAARQGGDLARPEAAEVEAAEHVLGNGEVRGPLPSEGTEVRGAAEEDVVEHARPGRHDRMLGDERDEARPARGGKRLEGDVTDADPAGVGDDAGERLHERRLARPVRADDAAPASRAHREVDPLEQDRPVGPHAEAAAGDADRPVGEGRPPGGPLPSGAVAGPVVGGLVSAGRRGGVVGFPATTVPPQADIVIPVPVMPIAAAAVSTSPLRCIVRPPDQFGARPLPACQGPKTRCPGAGPPTEARRRP